MPILDNGGPGGTLSNNFLDLSFIVSCEEIYEGVREGVARTMDGNAEHARFFKVVVNHPEINEVGVSLAPCLPKLGSTYLPAPAPDGPPTRGVPWDALALCYRISARQQDRDDWQIWIVTCLYTRNIPTELVTSQDPERAFNDPTMEGAGIFWDWETVQEAREYDLNGTPYLNMANQPFSPPRTRPVRYPVLIIKRNEAFHNVETMQRFTDALNDDVFLGYPKGCVQCDAPKAERKNRGPLIYWNYTYRLRFRNRQSQGGFVLPSINVLIQVYDPVSDYFFWQAFPNKTDMVDSWQPLLSNQGMYRLGSPAKNDLQKLWGLPIPIMKWGQQVHHQVLLDDKGQEARPDALPAAPPPGPGGTLLNNTGSRRIKPWYMQFIEFPYKSFTTLMVEGLS